MINALILLYFIVGVATAYVHYPTGHDWLADSLIITCSWPVFWFAWFQWWMEDSRDD